jgi:L-lactate dehydrogenase complex protein LldE
VRIALFVTCFNDTLFPGTGRAVVELLERLGHEVSFPLEQTCCGQLHANSGYQLEAVPLARRFARVFADEETIVSPSASCVAMVREQYPRLAELAGDAGLAREVEALAPRVLELSELHVGERPLRLLRAVRELELVELPGAEQCCGFGGTFAVKNADTSLAMLEDKLAAIEASGANAVVAADNSCLMQIGGGLRRRGTGVRTLHLAQVLASGAPS